MRACVRVCMCVYVCVCFRLLLCIGEGHGSRDNSSLLKINISFENKHFFENNHILTGNNKHY